MAKLSCEPLNVISESPVPSHISIRQSVLAASDKPSELISDPLLVRCVSFDCKLWQMLIYKASYSIISSQLDIVYSSVQ